MGISAKGGVYFWIDLFSCKSFGRETWRTYSHWQYSWEIFWQLKRLGRALSRWNVNSCTVLVHKCKKKKKINKICFCYSLTSYIYKMIFIIVEYTFFFHKYVSTECLLQFLYIYTPGKLVSKSLLNGYSFYYYSILSISYFFLFLDKSI